MNNFWRHVDKTATCWLWTGQMINGYGRHEVYGVPGARRRRIRYRAHRYAWELVNGPIPEGLVVDHLCGNRRCVNPTHLEIVTVNENSRRGARPVEPTIAIQCDIALPFGEGSTPPACG